MSAAAPDDPGRDAYLAALCALPGMTTARRRLLLARHPARQALGVACGDGADPIFTEHLRAHSRDRVEPRDWFARWRAHLAMHPVEESQDSLTACAASVLARGDIGYPASLDDDPDAPPVLFVRGDPSVLNGRRAGVVGTRSATSAGLRWATDVGRGLAEADVRVVSGLARGVDAAAHRGALAVSGSGWGPPVAVVASGPDVVYPRENAALWSQVVERGVLVSEHPPGTEPTSHAFPQRNRILAALSEVVVVVESRVSGGSLITVRHAIERDIGVLAVPGSVASRASEGTNRLLRDGVAGVALDATDVLVALGLDSRRAEGRRFDPRPRPAPGDQTLIDLIGGDAVSIDELVLRTGGEVVDIAVRLGRLERDGWVLRSGGWFVVQPDPEAMHGVNR